MGIDQINSTDSICDIQFRQFAVQTAPHKRTCRYHRTQGQAFAGDAFLAKGLCPHAFRIAYPHCLSLLYDAQYPLQRKATATRSVTVSCPSCDNRVEFTIRIQYTLPLVIRKIKTAAIRTLQFLGIDGEYPDRNIILEVSQVKGKCPIGIREGQSFLFNIWNRKELCPASFYTMYPVLIQQASFPGRPLQGEQRSVHCPDPFGVCYDYGTANCGWECQDFFSISAQVIEEAGHCPRGHRKGDCFKLGDMLPGGLCPLAFYTAFPYYLTLLHGGQFEWVRKGDCVKVQCPKADGVVMGVTLLRQKGLGEGAVRVSIIENKGICPKGHRPGDTFTFDSQNQPLCFHAAAAIIPLKTSSTAIHKCTCFNATDYLLFKME